VVRVEGLLECETAEGMPFRLLWTSRRLGVTAHPASRVAGERPLVHRLQNVESSHRRLNYCLKGSACCRTFSARLVESLMGEVGLSAAREIVVGVPVVGIVDDAMLIDNCRVRPEHIVECGSVKIIEIE
jgi:hypothetical protein